MDRRYFRILVFLGVIVSLMFGFSSKEATAEKAGEMIDINMSALIGVNWSPLFVAHSEGFYKAEGLNVKFVTPGGPRGFQAMHAGDCQFCMLSQEPLLIAQDKGIRSKIIATILGSRVYGIIASPEIKKISDLKGAAIFAYDPGSAPYTFTCNVLREAGLNPAKDVTCVQMNGDAAIMALENGGIKAAFINMNKVPELKNMKVNILVDATQKDDCLKYLGTNEFPAEIFCTTEDYAKKHPEICQKVVNAVINAQKWIQDHTDKEVAKSIAEHLTAIDINILAEEIGIMRNVYKPDCFISEKGENAVVKMCLDTGLIKRAIPYGEIVDMSFVNSYNK